MEFLSQTYVALRGPQGQPQTASDTIGRLSDRLSPATLLADRRAAVLALKGLARDHKQEVGERALAGLLETLYNDTEVDSEIGKAVLETLNTLCEVEEGNALSKEVGYKNTDAVLANEKLIHSLFALLGDANFYTRLATMQYLTTLLQNRRQVVQGYFLTAPVAASSIISVLEDKREIVRNEAITMVQALISNSPDIQKVLAFEGAFEKLFNTVTQEGGVDGGIVAQEALSCVDVLLRFNSSNQSYFLETGLPPILCALLQFPIDLPINASAPQEFALQFWDAQKLANASYIVAIMGMLIPCRGTHELAFTRCLVEIALGSNAPTALKVQALRLLPPSLDFPLTELSVTPYLPVPDTNGEEWDRLEATSALDTLIELVLQGEYNGQNASKRTKESLELRMAAAHVFENFVRKEEISHTVVQSLGPSEENQLPPTPLVISLVAPPNPTSDPAATTSTHMATLLFAHLLRSSPRSKSFARTIKPQVSAAGGGNFFVPADGPAPAADPIPDDDDEPQTILQILSENLSLSFLSRSKVNTSDREAREWDRLIVGYLCLLSQWLWEDPGSVKDFLDAGGLGMLVEPINQTSEVDVLVSGLCAFLLGICYEYNREPGEITRHKIHPILQRLGIDNLAGKMARLREDDRFKSVGPDATVLSYPNAHTIHATTKPGAAPTEVEGEIWFDWAFVDFFKSNYYSLQRGFSTDPDQISSSSGQNAESAMLIASLRDVIRQQSEEVEQLKKRLREQAAAAAAVKPPPVDNSQLTALEEEVASLSEALKQSEERKKEMEKEQEDLLVLLDEVTTKRKRDKAKMRESGLEVSEDEEGDEDDD